MYAEASACAAAQARCYQSEGTRRACSISELGARRRVTPDLWLGRAEPWRARRCLSAGIGWERIGFTERLQILPELKRCFFDRSQNLKSESPDLGLSSAVSNVHVNVSDHELRCSFM